MVNLEQIDGQLIFINFNFLRLELSLIFGRRTWILSLQFVLLELNS